MQSFALHLSNVHNTNVKHESTSALILYPRDSSRDAMRCCCVHLIIIVIVIITILRNDFYSAMVLCIRIQRRCQCVSLRLKSASK